METNNITAALVPGQTLGGCRVERLIGRGGMGEVYLAEHLQLQRPVALKVLPAGSVRPEVVDRFLLEARAGARVEHPNVVTIHDVGEETHIHFIVMQYVEGRNLAQLLKKQNGPLPWQSAAKVIRQAAKGLHAIHSQNLVHRDVKPSNIMLSAKGRVIVMDFGLIRQESGPDLTQSGLVVGTVPFMSPEQCRGTSVDRRTDIFSLGSTFYHLLTGQRPFDGPNAQVVHRIGSGKSPQPVHAVNPLVPIEVSEVVATAMSFRPDRRYRDAHAMAKAIGKVLHDRTTVVAPDDTVPITSSQPDAATIPELELVDSVSVEIKPIMLLWQRNCLIASGAVVALLLLALIVNLIPASQMSEDMVRIESGHTWLGNEERYLRRHLAGVHDTDGLNQMVELITEQPITRVSVETFLIDKYEVTNSQYAEFVRQTSRPPPSHFVGGRPPAGKEDHPVVNVSYDDAEAYAQWAGKKLPTHEQWMRAFRGDSPQLFPWGNQYDANHANVKENPRFPSTSPRDATPNDVSKFGVYNMVGNVSEMLVGSRFRKGNNFRVAKGAEWRLRGDIHGVGSMIFYYANNSENDESVGFRCVKELP